MCVGTVGQLNQQCSEDQQLRAHSFFPWRTALSQWFSNFSASESPGELVKPEAAGPQPQEFWFSKSGLRSKKLSLLISSPGDADLGTIHWEQLSRLTSITCPRGSWQVLPSRVTDWLKWGCENPATLLKIMTVGWCHPFSWDPQERRPWWGFGWHSLFTKVFPLPSAASLTSYRFLPSKPLA